MVTKDDVTMLLDNFIIYFSSDDNERQQLQDAYGYYIDELKYLPKGKLTKALKVKYLNQAVKQMADNKKDLADMRGTIPTYMKEAD